MTSNPPAFDLDHKLLKEAFEDHDEHLCIIKLHCEIEVQMHNLLNTVRGLDLSNGRTSFSQCILLLQAMGWPVERCEVLRQINNLRNAMVHKKEATLNNKISICEKIISHPSIRDFFHERFDDAVYQSPRRNISFKEMNLKEQVAFCLTLVVAQLSAGSSQWVFPEPQKILKLTTEKE